MGQPRYRIPPRRVSAGVNTMHKVLARATRLTEFEIRETMQPIQHCAARLREGVATELQVDVLRSTMLIALEIERLGHVRGMAGHIEAAMLALSMVHDRGLECGPWQPPALQLHELDAVMCMVDLHDHQLRQLTAGELQRATRRVIAQMQSQGGGKVVDISNEAIGLEVSP